MGGGWAGPYHAVCLLFPSQKEEAIICTTPPVNNLGNASVTVVIDEQPFLSPKPFWYRKDPQIHHIAPNCSYEWVDILIQPSWTWCPPDVFGIWNTQRERERASTARSCWRLYSKTSGGPLVVKGCPHSWKNVFFPSCVIAFPILGFLWCTSCYLWSKVPGPKPPNISFNHIKWKLHSNSAIQCRYLEVNCIEVSGT